MPWHPATPTPLVGRDEELATLVDLAGLDGDPPACAAVVVAGDAGVGKTRLLTALCETARNRGWQVLVGHCLDLGDSALPYLPFTEAFSRTAEDSPARTRDLVEHHPTVLRLLPDHLGGGQLGPPSDHRAERAELFEAIRGGLQHLAAAAPLLLVVEDVHWADQSTRDVLTYLFTRQTENPVSVVVSYRSDDLHRRHPLRTTAAQWARTPGVRRLQLKPLSGAHVRALLAALHPDPLPEDVVADIVARAEGNAFFAEELLAAATLGGGALPDDLADLLLVRVDRLDEAARDVVRAASAAGRRVTHQLLAAVAGLDGDRLDQALRAAVDGNVLVAVDDDAYAFRHALLGEAAYADLLPGERVRLHRAYTKVLTSDPSAGTAAELARHARAANEPEIAITASITAGDEAMAVAGPDEAALHYETALELLTQGGAGLEPSATVDLAVKAVEAAVVAGHHPHATRLASEQLRHLPPHVADHDRARLLHALASAAILAENPPDLVAVTGEALDLIAAEEPSRLRAQLLSLRARALYERYEEEEARRWADEALELAQTLDLPDVAADATTTLVLIQEYTGLPADARPALEARLEGARAAGETAVELRVMFNLGNLLYEAAELEEAQATLEAAVRRAAATGRQWAPYAIESRALAAVTRYVRGDWAGADRLADVTGQAPPPTPEALLAAVRMLLAAGRGDGRALGLLESIRPWWERNGMVAVMSGAATIDLHGDRGELDAAVAVHDDLVGTMTRLAQNEGFQARVRLAALLLGHLATQAATVRTAERARLVERGQQLVDSAALTLTRNRDRGRRTGPETAAWEARVAAEHARLRWLAGSDPPAEDELVTLWRDVVTAFEAFGHTFETARCTARLAAVLRAVGAGEEADVHAAAAQATATRLGAAPLLRELQALGTAGPRRRSTPGSRLDQPLTRREQEVLALVAEGRSNGEIGRQLFISAKTVSVHVSNILAKLGAAGRTEAVAIARRRGQLRAD